MENIAQNIINDILPADIFLAKNGLGINDMFADMYDNPQRYIIKSDEENIIPISQKDRIRMTPSEWALKYRSIKGRRMSFDKFPYQKQILDDMHPKIVIEKAAQLGLSEVSLTKMFWFCDYNMAGPGGKIIYTFPTFSDMCTYASARIPQIIEDSMPCTPSDFGYRPEYEHEPVPYVQSILTSRSFSRVARVRETFVFLKGTFNDSSAISIDSDWNIHDEVNFSNQSVLNKFKSRLGAATSLGWECNFSTPTIPEYGISKMFAKSDQHWWTIKCPHCGKSYVMEFERNLTEIRRNGRYEYMYVCHHCRNEISDETRAKGFYVAQSPSIKDLRGYHIDKMGNPNLSANALIASKNGYRKVSDFHNFDLGLAYSEKTTSLTEEILEQLKYSLGKNRTYQMSGFATLDDYCTMGVDQGDTLWVEITARDKETGKRKIIYAESVDYKNFSDEDPFQRLPELIDRYKVRVCVIDALPNKNSSRWLKNKYKDHEFCKVFMAYYTSTRDGDMNVNKDEGVVNIDRTETFKWTFNRIYNSEVAIPSGMDIMELWKEHMKNLKKEMVENEQTGDVKEMFVKTGADHFNHAHLYNEVATLVMEEFLNIEKPKGGVGLNGDLHWYLRGGSHGERRNGLHIPQGNEHYGGVEKVPMKTRVRKGRY